MGNNTKLPAYPLPLVNNSEGEIKDASDWDGTTVGFTKLELASIMVMQGMLSNSLALDQGIQPLHTYQPLEMAYMAVQYAKAVLEEANK